MGLVTERLYDESKPLYLSKNVKFDGRDYKKGDDAPIKDMSQRTLLKYFRTGLFVHEVRKAKSEAVDQVVEPAAPKKRTRKTTKAKAE